jgi:cytochrome c oxidase assembly factor CtaG
VIASILTQWSLDPSVVAGLAALTAVYWRFARKKDWRFIGAIILAFLALESPLDYLSDQYLLSAHMVQHMVLILGVAPFLALSIPPSLSVHLARQPVGVFVAFTIDLLAWHVPVAFEATLHHEWLHVVEHLTFIAFATAFWWVVFAGPLSMPARMLYIFLAGIPNTLLGAIITFAPSVLYPTYQLALDRPGLGRVLQTEWGITAHGDQQLGGLIMWVPGGMVYLLAIVAVFLSSAAGRQRKAEAVGPLES